MTAGSAAHPPAPGRAALGAGLLIAGFVANLGGILGLVPPVVASEIASAFVLAYLALFIARASRIVKAFFILALVLLVWGTISGALSAADIARGADRMAFLSCLLLALIFLRLVAARDDAFERAGAFLANQPPSRRYVSLGVGGNVFGVLLNLGGLGLLIEMTRAGQRRGESLRAVTVQVHELRERRIISAILRGFATIALWSPFGVALNTLLLIYTDLHWGEFAPYGLAFAALFLATGTILDAVERRLFPVRPRPPPATPAPGEGRGMLIVAGHLCALCGIVLTADFLLPLAFQSLLIALVPLYAFAWITRLAGRPGPALLIGDFRANAPRYVNEVGVFALAGLIGALLAVLVPDGALTPVLDWTIAHGGAASLSLALMWGTVLAAMVGLHPIITVAILAEFMLRTDILSDRAVVLSLLSGWTCTVCLAPLATTATYVGAIIDRDPITVTWRWNGVFGAVILTLLSASLVGGLATGLI
ncbi:MAG: hypothetical protein WBA25_15065 [Jannaschia sp.]